MRNHPHLVIGMALLLAQPAAAAGVRDFTRSTPAGTAVSEIQANELTQTEAAMRPIQHMVRVAIERGPYRAQDIKSGLESALYTQVEEGLKDRDQVDSVGSFFVAAGNKPKLAAMAPIPAPQAGAAAGAAGGDTVLTDPQPNAKVKAPVYMIHVMFQQPVNAKASKVEIINAAGRTVDAGEVMDMSGDGKTLMAMPKTPLPAGTYRVRWSSIGANAKTFQGEFSFTAQ